VASVKLVEIEICFSLNDADQKAKNFKIKRI